MTTQPSQLSFELDNPGAANTIYISTDPAANQLSLKVATTVDTVLVPGDVVPIDQAKQTGVTASLFYLDLSPLGLTENEFEQLTLDGSDWNFHLYVDKKMIGFAPKTQQSLTTSAPLSLSLNDFALAKQPPSTTPTLAVYYFRAYPDQKPEPTKRNFSVSVLPPPNEHDLDLHPAIAVKLDPAEVVNCPAGGAPLYNELTLILSPGANFIPVPAGSDTAFELSFVYADDVDGFGAMMTAEQAQPPFSVTPGPDTTDWKVKSNTNSQFPSWILQPPPKQPIVATNSPKSFVIKNLATHFQPGPTVVSVTYQKIPGYRNGVYSIPVLKQPHVAIESFTATPERSVMQKGGDNVEVTLSWQTSDATRLTLQPGLIDVTGLTSKVVSISQTTQYTLIAEGKRPGNVDNFAYADCTAYVVPVVDFEAHPASVYQADFPYAVELSWSVSTGGDVILTSSVPGQGSALYPPADQVQRTVSVPQMFTLSPQAGGAADSRNVIVSAFSPAAKVISNGLTGAGVAAPEAAPFIAMAVPAVNQVVILSTANFQTLQTVSVGASPRGLAFSPDGAALYVANSGDGTVSVIRVTNTNSAKGYSFGVVNTVHVGGAPQQVAVSPDGSAWVSVDARSDAGTLARITDGLFTPAVVTVPVGAAPRGVAVKPSGGLVFVANADSGSVSVIANSANGPQVLAPVPNMNRPVDVAVSPDGTSLLVATAGDSSIVKVDIKYYQTAPGKRLPLADTPAYLAKFRGGDYVVVGCSSTAILLNTKTGTTTSVDLSGAAQGVGITPEDGMALVSVAGQDGSSVVTFNRYAQQGQPTQCDYAISDAAVTPDGALVLAWNNALLDSSSGPPPLEGVVAFSTDIGDLTPAAGLSTGDFAHLVISPGRGDDAFYAAPAGESSISVFQTSTMTPLKSIPLPPKQGVKTRSAVRLALSADGSTLFALTNDGSRAFSIVVFAANIANRVFTPVADLSVFQSESTPASWFLAAAPDGSGAYTIDPIASEIHAIELSGGTWALGPKSVTLPDQAQAYALFVLPDGSAAYAFATDDDANVVGVIRLSGFELETIYLPDSTENVSLTAITCSPDGRFLLGTDQRTPGVRVLDAASLRIVQTLAWPTRVVGPTGIAISPDGSRIFVASTGRASSSIAVADQLQPQL
ncbi:YncE family protein [Burkholderia arboris]|uniref:YncE family protein n=1 Tax=Burkholderia arboris TaxID=488730 RepID=UPI0030EFEA9B